MWERAFRRYCFRPGGTRLHDGSRVGEEHDMHEYYWSLTRDSLVKLLHNLWNYFHKELLLVHQLEVGGEGEGGGEREEGWRGRGGVGRGRRGREGEEGGGQTFLTTLPLHSTGIHSTHPDVGLAPSVQHICQITEDELEPLSCCCAEDWVTQEREKLGGHGTGF